MSVAEVETKRDHENFLTTTYASLVNWARKSSLWPYPFGTACCAIEFMATMSAHYDLARFGAEVVRFAPKQSDVLMVLGTINDKMGPVLKQIYAGTLKDGLGNGLLGDLLAMALLQGEIDLLQDLGLDLALLQHGEAVGMGRLGHVELRSGCTLKL